MITGLLILVLFISGCGPAELECEKPFMKADGKCCLDLDDNDVCDEKQGEKEPEVKIEETKVVEKDNGMLRLKVMTYGEISDGKGVNIPNKQLSVPSLSKKDLEIIDFAKKFDIEYLALSFTRNIQDINILKSKAQGSEVAIIAKIENLEGVKNFEEISNGVDGVMIARGGLGVEIEPERVPLVQKSIIKSCNQKGKTVITATEMLESMMYRQTPTRAEVSDVTNAILDGTDVTMLSGETSIGKYPVESVSMMSRIAREAETAARRHVEDGKFINISDTVSKSIQNICRDIPFFRHIPLYILILFPELSNVLGIRKLT